MPDNMPTPNIETLLHSVGEQINMSSQSGTLSFDYPLRFPTGRNNFQPAFNISYSQSSVNSIFGRGWTGTTMKISRKLQKKLPIYNDEEDVFTIGMIGEIVPLLDEYKNRVVKTKGDYKIYYYKAVNETSFARIERRVNFLTSNTYWLVFMSDNTTYVFGETPAEQIVNPQDETKIFEWLLSKYYDDKGNVIYYEYKAENLDNVDLSLSYETKKTNHLNQKYLKRILYGNTIPYEDNLSWKSQNKWLFEVVFDFGEHATLADEAYSESTVWSARYDTYANYHAGFELRTYRKCERVLFFSRFSEDASDITLHASVELKHRLKDGVYELEKIVYTGYKRGENGYTQKSLPPICFTYSQNYDEYELQTADIHELKLENIPYSVDGIKYSWVDLYKDGINGILVEYPNVWYYKPNLGAGKFGELELVGEKPSMIANSQYQLVDLDRNGQLNCLVYSEWGSGYYEQDIQTQEWGSFQNFKNTPKGGNLYSMSMDLDGEGGADILQLNADGGATWYNAKGKDGYSDPEPIQIPEGIPLSAKSSSQELFTLADMTGDGMQDLVLVRNNTVSYWPQMGYGNFGEEVVMEGNLQFDNLYEFDVSRLLLADVGGTGTTDLIYIGTDKIKIYHNHSGNRFELQCTLNHLGMALTNFDRLEIMDVLGNGVKSLVWSTFLPGQTTATIRYLPLSAEPPHLLTMVDNNLGHQSKIKYTSSLFYFLEDRRNDAAWHSRIVNHPFVVEQIQDIDLIGGTTLVKTFRYRDGVYDGIERGFMGFAYVEEYDTEQFEEYSDLPSEDYVAATLIKSWYYNGLLGNDMTYTKKFYEQNLEQHITLPKITNDRGIPIYLNEEEIRQALLLLNGQLGRQEVHRLDMESQQLVSFSQYGYGLHYHQPKQSEDHKAVFSLITTESIDYLCDSVSVSDALITHQLNLSVDKYGQITETCQINYGRKTTGALDEQKTSKCVFTKSVLLHYDEDENNYVLGIPLESESYEITGLDLLYNGAIPIKIEALKLHIVSALQDRKTQSEKLDYRFPQSKKINHTKQFYTQAASTDALAFGMIQFPVLGHHTESIAFEKSWALQTWQEKVDVNKFIELGYKEADAVYWTYSNANEYYGLEGFYLPKIVHHPLGGQTHYEYDLPNWLFTTKAVNPLGHLTTIEYDYQALAPFRQIDANGNVLETLYDELGVAIVSTHYGTEIDKNGVLKEVGYAKLSDYQLILPDSMTALLASPQDYIKYAASYRYYDLMAWMERQEPLLMVNLSNEEYVSTIESEQKIQIALGYIDGFGRNIQSKLWVEPGMALSLTSDGQLSEIQSEQRWLVSGRVLYNNKQLPIKQYEPFYSAQWQYESESVLDNWGEAHHYFYDALGRNIKTVTPLGIFEKVEYSPWKQLTYDAIDTLKDSLYYTINSSLPTSHPIRQMLNDTEIYYDTPTIQHLDNLGRTFLLQQTDEQGQELNSYTEFDIVGNPLKVVDARGIVVMESHYTLSGLAVYQKGADIGERWSLYNAIGINTDNWGARGQYIQQKYDLLQRPIEVWVNGQLLQRNTYGNGLLLQEAQAKNALGQLIRVEDASGIKQFSRYNIAGQLLAQQQQISTEYKSGVDWSNAVALEPEIYSSIYEYDALGRLVQHEKPDGTIHIPSYHQSGRVKGLALSGIGGDENQTHQFQTDSVFNARGQLENLYYGNGVKLQYEYDSKLYRLKSFKAIHHQANGQHRHLQWNQYFYDAVGNVVRLEDHALAGLLHNNVSLPMVKTYRYDAHYRLKEATGVIHQTFTQWDGTRNQYSQPIAFKGTQHIHLNNTQAVETYTRTYGYDQSGNMLEMKHQGQSKRWTRNYWVSPDANRSIAATDSNGLSVSNPETYFDASGNLIKFGHLRQVRWDAFNQLTAAVLIERTDGPNDAEYYVYDSSGMRSRKVTERLVNGQVEIIEKIYLEGCELTRKRNTNSGQISYEATTTHVLGEGGSRIALIHHIRIGAEADEPTTRIRYQIGNHLGSVAMETDELGQIISYEEYFPFGGTAFLFGENKREVGRKVYRYSGKERDDATGLYYYGFRYYAPWLCRWLNPDPGGLRDGTNLYAFVQNNPVNFVDAWGLETFNTLEEAFGANHGSSLPSNIRTVRQYKSYWRSWGVEINGPVDISIIKKDDVTYRVFSLAKGTTLTVDMDVYRLKSMGLNADQIETLTTLKEVTSNLRGDFPDISEFGTETDGANNGNEQGQGEEGTGTGAEGTDTANPDAGTIEQGQGGNPDVAGTVAPGNVNLEEPIQTPSSTTPVTPNQNSNPNAKEGPIAKSGVSGGNSNAAASEKKKKTAVPPKAKGNTGTTGGTSTQKGGAGNNGQNGAGDLDISSMATNGSPNGSIYGDAGGTQAAPDPFAPSDSNGGVENGGESSGGDLSGSPQGVEGGSGNDGGTGSEERSFWSRGGTTLLLGGLALGLGLLTIFTAGATAPLLVLLAGGMATAGGLAVTTASATQLGMSYSGATTANQDKKMKEILSDTLGLSSPGGLVGGAIGAATADDPVQGMRTGSLIGGFAELGIGGVQAVRNSAYFRMNRAVKESIKENPSKILDDVGMAGAGDDATALRFTRIDAGTPLNPNAKYYLGEDYLLLGDPAIQGNADLFEAYKLYRQEFPNIRNYFDVVSHGFPWRLAVQDVVNLHFSPSHVTGILKSEGIGSTHFRVLSCWGGADVDGLAGTLARDFNAIAVGPSRPFFYTKGKSLNPVFGRDRGEYKTALEQKFGVVEWRYYNRDGEFPWSGFSLRDY